MPRRTTNEAATYFKEQGCELIDEYVSAVTKMKYRCSCGEIGYTSWNNFTAGKRCGKCAKTGHSKKRSLDEVKRIFAQRGCEFLDPEFNGIHYRHRYRCKCGRETEITFAAFHLQEQFCFECGRDKNKGPGNPAWIADREQKRLNDLFRKKCYKALSSSLKAVGKDKVGRTSDMLGYTPKQLQEHIKSHPNWSQVKDGNWHLDHIFPVKAFLDHGITDIALINSLDNLRPATQKTNNEKWAHYDKEEFKKWFLRSQWTELRPLSERPFC